MSHRSLSLVVCLAAASLTVGAQVKKTDQNKEQNRLANCGVVMTAFRRRVSVYDLSSD